jgi:cytochrome c-type biogenesis protein CcmH
MTPEERQAMIAGMVGQLSDRLATEGGPATDWARLIKALGVLGQTDQARAILTEARTTFAANAADLAVIDAAAREAGL